MITELDRNLIQRANLADCLRRSATLYPDRVAITDEESSLTYAELHRGANQVARGLQELGIGKGDFVGLIFRNCPEFFHLYFACARIGAIALPLNPHLRDDEYALIASEARPKVMVVFADYLEAAERLASLPDSALETIVVRVPEGSAPPPESENVDHRSLSSLYHDDDSDVEEIVGDRNPVQCIYTSGTTASPKGVITSHLAAMFTGLTAAHHMNVRPGDVGLVVLPVHHVGGLNDTTIPYLMIGATVVLHDGWNAAKVAPALDRHSVTSTLLTAPMWMELLVLNAEREYDWSAMRTCMCGIATLPPDKGDQLREICPNADVLLASGQTEMTGFQECQTTEHQFDKPTAWGAPSLVTDVAIMNDEGELVGPNVQGEIVYRGPQAMTEYFAHPDLTEETFKHGWLHSGDLGYVDEDHTVFFVDRKKDMIKTGGENVASVEVTLAVLSCPGVADCAVVGLPHARWSEAITAFVQPEPDAAITEDEVIEHCRKQLASFKVPKKVILTDTFPRTASGKIQKVKLRQQFADEYQ